MAKHEAQHAKDTRDARETQAVTADAATAAGQPAASSAPGKPGKASKRDANGKKRSGGIGAALCNVLGTLILLVVIGLCLPLTVPLLAGYDVFEVVSGSMEPEIPVGSAVYAKSTDLADVQEGEILAFREGNEVIVHRVVANRSAVREFVTKGDANNVEDLEPIPYEAVIGRVEHQLPYVGAFMAIYASAVGKLYLLLTAACGVMLNMLASRMRETHRRRLEQKEAAAAAKAARAASAAGGATAGAQAAQAPKRRNGLRALRTGLMVALLIVFLGSGGVIGFVNWQYGMSDARYHAASESFTSATNAGKEAPPISINFAALQAKNPDVVGWIYCEDTVIDYPLLKGESNDYYLSHDYTRDYNIDGSIFVDAANADDFADANTIIYGHHMNSGSMFATLEKWADQDFFDKHPVFWILTPKQNYKAVLFSAHHADAYSAYYDIIPANDPAASTFLESALKDSDIKPPAGLNFDSRTHYVMMSTCAYLFDNDRYVLHGILQPV